MMAQDIQPLSDADLPELSQFLTEGFHAPVDAPFAAPDVLRWKYLEPRGDSGGTVPQSYLARDQASGRIVGHVGICLSRFSGGNLPPEGISTLHMIDWLASADGAGVGATLMRRAHQGTETQYGLGGSAAGRGVADRGGYALIARVPVHHNVLRPTYRLRTPGAGPIKRVLRAVKDTVRKLARPARKPAGRITLARVESFGAEIEPILSAYRSRAIFTSRDPWLLNHVLRYPRGGISGWHLRTDGVLRGFAALAVVPQPGGVRTGKIVDCILDLTDDALWHAAFMALTAALKRQGADLAVAFASTEWAAQALGRSGYAPVHNLEFRLRDRSSRIPRGATFHLTALEADYAFT
jgi:hypothetical protein